MIMYFMFFIMLTMGSLVFMYGAYMEYSFYIELQLALKLPQPIIPIGFYIMIASAFIFIATTVFIIIRIKTSGAGKRFDKTPKNQGLFDFIYRSGDIKDVYGTRIPGLGLFRILNLGMIFDIGREPAPGSIYNVGDKKLRFALQDINYTPNAKFPGFYRYLKNLGFNNMTEFQDVLNGYNPDLMLKVWNRLIEQEEHHPEDVIVNRVKNMNKRELEANNRLFKYETRKIKEPKEITQKDDDKKRLLDFIKEREKK